MISAHEEKIKNADETLFSEPQDNEKKMRFYSFQNRERTFKKWASSHLDQSRPITYCKLFSETRATLSGERPLFANTRRAITIGSTAFLFLNSREFLYSLLTFGIGGRGLFPNTRATLKASGRKPIALFAASLTFSLGIYPLINSISFFAKQRVILPLPHMLHYSVFMSGLAVVVSAVLMLAAFRLQYPSMSLKQEMQLDSSYQFSPD